TPVKESLVFPVVQFGDTNRTAQSAAEIMAPVKRAVLAPISAIVTTGTAANTERVSRVQILIDEILEPAAVILIRPRLHGHVDDHAPALSELGGVVTGLVADFLNRIHIGLRHAGVLGQIENAVAGVLTLNAIGRVGVVQIVATPAQSIN